MHALYASIGLVICAVCLVAPNAVADYSRARWLGADLYRWPWGLRWRRGFTKLVVQPWYPLFIRCYGLFGSIFFLYYLVFVPK
jgi:hypothetical protein